MYFSVLVFSVSLLCYPHKLHSLPNVHLYKHWSILTLAGEILFSLDSEGEGGLTDRRPYIVSSMYLCVYVGISGRVTYYFPKKKPNSIPNGFGNSYKLKNFLFPSFIFFKVNSLIYFYCRIVVKRSKRIFFQLLCLFVLYKFFTFFLISFVFCFN